MKEEGLIKKEVKIPAEVRVKVSEDKILVSGPKGELQRNLEAPLAQLKQADGSILIQVKGKKRRAKALVGTWEAHLNNMFRGVSEGFRYKLKVNYSHFPVKVFVKDKLVLIENFLGEHRPRKARIVGDTKVLVSKEAIEISGIDREAVGQTTANLRLATKIRNRDPRVFKDGFYLFKEQKGG
jgi:large subunit ribosomal protein L6